MRWIGRKLYDDNGRAVGDLTPGTKNGEKGWDAELVGSDGEVICSHFSSSESESASWLLSEAESHAAVLAGLALPRAWVQRAKMERERLGWSMNKLARRAGVDHSTISDMETGRCAPSSRTKTLVDAALRSTRDGREELIRSLMERVEKLERWRDGVISALGRT